MGGRSAKCREGERGGAARRWNIGEEYIIKKKAEKVNRTLREGEGRKVEHGGGGEGWMIKEYKKNQEMRDISRGGGDRKRRG